MYLKNIEVQGFKSFAQKINFEFHNGITGIVGPNGSGKSNVGDAVRWVLGEQSAKQLRGGNMQDVIFSGTETRKPLSFASVAITLDNSDHKLPVDFQEVTVTRRLYRSGESEYLINGSACRLKDIHEMFYDTGIGKEGYSIIGQGQIDKILSGKPEERRELFDEAAGIVKFKRRKNTTIKKLEEEQQNLVRVTDILSELTRQLTPLEKQAETAKIYLGKREALKELDVNLFLAENEHTESLLKELEEKTKTAEHQLQETGGAYEKTKEEYDRLEKELESLEEKMESLREETQGKALQKQQLEGQINVLNEQLSAGEQNREHYESRLLSIAEELSKKEEAKKEQQEEGELLKEKTSEMKKKMKKKEEALSNVQENIRECSAAVEDGKNEIIEILNTRATTKGKAQRFDTMMEQIGIRKAELSQKILKLKSEEEEQSGAMKRAAAKYEAITALIEEMNEECTRLNEEVFSIQEQLKNQNGQMEAGQAAYHREASRLDSLKNMAERYDGYGNSIRRVMEQKERVPGIEGVVADLIQVNKDYEIAIETALGGSIQNIVTDNEQTAKQMIEFLKKNRFGRATFLPLSSVNARGEFSQKEALKEEGVIGLASELVNAAPRYQGVIRYLLGRVLVVDHIDHAIAIGRKYRHTLRMVTIEGESLSPGGSMTGGAFRNNSNLLGRKREIEELEKKVRSLKTELEEMQKSIDESRSKRNVIRDTIADFKEKLRLQYIEQNTAKMSMNQLEEKNEQIQRGYLQVQRDQMDMQRQVREVQEDHSRIKKELEESQKDEKELETFIETRQQELDEWKNEESEVLKELENIRLEVSSMGQKTQFTMENLSRLSSEISSFTEEKEKIRENLKLVKEEMEKKRKDISHLKNTIANFDEEEKASKGSLKVLIEEKEERNKSHKAFFEKRDALSSQMSLLDKECFRLKSQAEKIEENREAQISYMWEEYEITPNNALQYKKEELTDRQEMQKEIGKIKEEIRCLGTVNVNAIEDYKELLERHTFLSNQYEDLQQAEKTLEQIIEELDEGMRKQFSEKFREIQREFDKAFKELFGGGKGTLELSMRIFLRRESVLFHSHPEKNFRI